MIPFNKPFIVGKELYYIAMAVLGHGHLSGDGPFTKKCHRWLEEALGCRKALLTHSCTAALEMAAHLADVQPGDEVIMPSFTFVSTANAFVLKGARPVFIDIRPDTLNMNEEHIEAAITERTRLIVPIHYAGVPCAMDRIMAIAEARGLLVVEDAAQALLSRHEDRCLGTLGHFGCLSFHETKNIIAGEGGALLVNDERFLERAEIIREKGTNRSKFLRGEVDKYTWVDIGSSYLPSELTAAFLYAQMELAEQINARRRLIFETYSQHLAPLAAQGRIETPSGFACCHNNGHLFYILAGSLDERTRLIDHLKAAGIRSAFHYVPLHSSPAGRKYGRQVGDLAVTDLISDRLLRLPLYHDMTQAEALRVAEAVQAFYAR